MKKLALYWQILIAFALSVLYGLFFGEHIYLVAWMGDVFIKALKMIIIPLIFTSIISGIANVGSGDNRKSCIRKMYGFRIEIPGKTI